MSRFIGKLETKDVKSGSVYISVSSLVLESVPSNVQMNGMKTLVQYLKDKKISLWSNFTGPCSQHCFADR